MRPSLWRSPTVLLALTLFSPATASAQLSLTLDSQTVTVTGATASGEVVLWSAAKRVEDHSVVASTGLEVLAADAAGTVVHLPAGGVPSFSLWLVVDRRSGAVALAAPPALPDLTSAFQPAVWQGAAGLEPAEGIRPHGQTIHFRRRALEVLWIRGDVGIWHLGAGDGAAGDDDLEMNGQMELDLAKLEPLTPTDPPTPEVLTAGDRLFALDLDTMEHYFQTLAAEWQPTEAP